MNKVRNLYLTWVLCGLVLTFAVIGWSWGQMHGATSPELAPGNPLFPPDMNVAAVAQGDVIGDLGGVKVRIPAHFANYVEYDGDPGFGEKRQGTVPKRTIVSKLRSFGFEVRFPDMAGRSTPQLWQDYRNRRPIDSQWLSVGITSGHPSSTPNAVSC